MKPLANRILDAIPSTPHGLSLRTAVDKCGSDLAHTRAAFDVLDKDGRARIVKRGRNGAIYLVHADAVIFICAVCQKEFEPPIGTWTGKVKGKKNPQTRHRKSDRETCSNSCHAKLRHRRATPEQKEAWRKTLSRAQSTPEALARLAAHNARRWSDPEQHKRLSEQNRERARIRREDPEAFERYRAMMRFIQNTPEKKKLYSELRKQWWADPAMRKKMTDAVNASEAVQEYRRNFGEHNKRRWQNPELRAKYTSANTKRNSPELRKANGARMREQWKDPAFKEKMAQAARDRDNTALHEKAIATRRKRGWLKKNRPKAKK